MPDAVLDDLRRRLGDTRWPEPIPGADWDYGANVDDVRDLCAYWRDGYDWRAHEAQLNALPGFLCGSTASTCTSGTSAARRPTAFPLLLLHGWPGSIYEFHRVLGPLSERLRPRRARAAGLRLRRQAARARLGRLADRRRVRHADVSELGYERYGVQGGDWGAIVAAKLGAAYPERVAGIHVNILIAPPPPDPAPEDAEAVEQLTRTGAPQEAAYSLLQRTKPDSLTVAQSDSPAGLAAWIVEKFRAWSDCDGDVEGSSPRHAADEPHVLLGARQPRAPRGSTTRAARPRRPGPTRPRRGARRPTRRSRARSPAAAPWVERHYAIRAGPRCPAAGTSRRSKSPSCCVDDVRAFFECGFFFFFFFFFF